MVPLQSSPLDGTDAALAVRSQGPGVLRHLARYLSLTKPRVLAGNVLTALAGFALASAGSFDLGALLAVTIGTTLVIASACVVNNILDRDIDQLMARTRRRVSVTGTISLPGAITFAVLLGVLGLATLVRFSGIAVAVIGAIGFFVYVVLYGMWSKRQSQHGTLMGSVSGAIPILAGYVAVTGTVDATAALAFSMMFLWQEPEFYSIAIYRRDEYAAAGVPVVTVTRGIAYTKRLIFVYTILFSAAALALPLFGGVGVVYTVVMGLLCAGWLGIAYAGFRTPDDALWVRRNFRYSLWVVLVMSAMFAVGPILP